MAFNKKTWTDRNTEYPGRRKLTKVSGEEDTYDVTRAEGTISDPGNAFNAQEMNDLEDRIEEGFNNIPSASATTNGLVRMSYGTSLPSSGVEGQIFFLLES